MSFHRLQLFVIGLLILGSAGLLVVFRSVPSSEPVGTVAGWQGALPEAAIAAADLTHQGIAVLVDGRFEPLLVSDRLPEHVRMASDGKTIAWNEVMAGRSSVIRYDLVTGQRQTILTTKDTVDALWLSDDSQSVAALSHRRSPSTATSLTILDAGSHTPTVINQGITDAAWSPSGRALAITGSAGVGYIDGSPGGWSSVQPLPLPPVPTLDWLDDRRLLVVETTDTDQRLVAYDLADQTRQEIQTLSVAGPTVRLRLSPNSRFALVIWYDGDRLVEGTIVDMQKRLTNPLPTVSQVDWTRAGSLLATVIETDGPQLWLIDPVTLRSTMVTESLTGAGQ